MGSQDAEINDLITPEMLALEVAITQTKIPSSIKVNSVLQILCFGAKEPRLQVQ